MTEMDSTGVELIENGSLMRSTIQQIAAHGVNSMVNAAEHG